MTEKELKRLNRRELLEILLEQVKENELLKAEISELKAKLEEREIKLSAAGNIAEASLELNNVFKSAQMAAEQYIDNVRALNPEADAQGAELILQAEEQARKIIEEAKLQRNEILNSAQVELSCGNEASSDEEAEEMTDSIEPLQAELETEAEAEPELDEASGLEQTLVDFEEYQLLKEFYEKYKWFEEMMEELRGADSQ